ncbi:MAG: pyridoxal phosphate-dependent decarboxylase family protein [Longimicrobiales bacterium]
MSNRIERTKAIALTGAEFRAVGHELVDRLADLIDGIADLPVAQDSTPRQLRALLPAGGMPAQGEDLEALFAEVLPQLIETSTFNAHPRFFGYISGSPAPAGILADLVASAFNPNCGAAILSPLATEIEKQTITWLSELIGFPANGAGILVSGGNMANMVCFMAARAAQAPDARTSGLRGLPQPLVAYASAETHTWINKAADICGLGAESVRNVDIDGEYRMRAETLRKLIRADLSRGLKPFVVVATGGSVSTGAIDPIQDIAAICREHDIWLHVDGAYGAPAAMLPDAHADLKASRLADSIALDPHKWLYAPMEAGAALVRDPDALRNAFAYRPSYYRFEGAGEDPSTNFYEHGLQNSRGFRALKVWISLRHLGRANYERLIAEDIALARLMYETAEAHAELEAVTHNLSIATFRYLPEDLRERRHEPDTATYLNELNTAIVAEMQANGQVFLSNAVLDGRYVLRGCIVNFRTTERDARMACEVAVAVGRKLDAALRLASVAR